MTLLDKYNENPDQCIFCGAENPDLNIVNATTNEDFYSCNDCGKSWKLVFEVVAVEEVTE